jgi:CNT family concentrative nucleoside transporter
MPEMTESELHAVMTGGFATIAGSVFGIYISFGKTEEVKVPCAVYWMTRHINHSD